MKTAELAILSVASYAGAWLGSAVSEYVDIPPWLSMTIGALICWGAAFAALTTDIVITVKP